MEPVIVNIRHHHLDRGEQRRDQPEQIISQSWNWRLILVLQIHDVLTFSGAIPQSLDKVEHRSVTVPSLGTTTRYCGIKGKFVKSKVNKKKKNKINVPCFKEQPKAHLRGSGLRVRTHQENLHCSILLHGERQREVAERIKGYRHLGALWAHQGGLEKTVENIHYYGVVTQAMVCPGLLGNNLMGERKTKTPS